jgi:enoyl-CoA hydratase
MNSSYTTLLTELKDGIFTITINRPDKMNALNANVFLDLRAAMQEVYDLPAIKGVIITGAGPKAFIAGADIAEFANYDAPQGKLMSATGHAVFNSIENCPKPIIAAINGFALGGGCELAMACHLRVAADNARFGQPEVNLGIIPGYGGTQRFIQYIGKGKALELLMTTDMILADEAHRLGLVNHVVAPENLISKATELLQKIFTKGPVAIAKVIECVNAHFDSTHSAFELEINSFSECMNTADFKEGTTAFVEKRKAQFTGQ